MIHSKINARFNKQVSTLLSKRECYSGFTRAMYLDMSKLPKQYRNMIKG